MQAWLLVKAEAVGKSSQMLLNSVFEGVILLVQMLAMCVNLVGSTF